MMDNYKNLNPAKVKNYPKNGSPNFNGSSKPVKILLVNVLPPFPPEGEVQIASG